MRSKKDTSTVLQEQIDAWVMQYEDAVSNNADLEAKIQALDKGIEHARTALEKTTLISDTITYYELPTEWAGENANDFAYALSSNGDIASNVKNLASSIDDYIAQLERERADYASQVDVVALTISNLASLLGF